MAHASEDRKYSASGKLPFEVPMELFKLWETSDEAWCLKDKYRNLVYMNENYKQLVNPRNKGSASALSYFKPNIYDHDGRVIEKMGKVDALGILPTEYTLSMSIFFAKECRITIIKLNLRV